MQIYTIFQRSASIKAFNIACGILLGYAIYVNFYRITFLDMIFYKVAGSPILPSISILIFYIVPSVLAMFLLEKFYCRKCRKILNATARVEYCQSMLPLLGMTVFSIMPVNFWSPIIFIFIIGIVVFRYVAACLAVLSDTPLLKDKTVHKIRIYLIIILFGMIASGFYMQYFALDALYLLYYDWGVYLSVTDNLLKGNGFVMNKGEPSFLGSHFSPASILMMAPYIWLFYSKYAIFILNSLMLYSCAPMIYWFAKSKKIPEIQALLLAGCVVASPSLSNMNLAIFYGFHDIVFFMPLLILFFIFYEKKIYIPAFAVFGLTLMIKETIPVFWVGMGIAFVFYGRRKSGLWIIVIATTYWLTVLKLIIPWISGQAVYDYAGRFEYLGVSLWEIALSPLLKPALFWGHLLRPQCIFFGILLLLPFFLLCFSWSVLLVGGIISFVFICLQSSDQLQNICMQYQTEILALIFINCVFALDRLNHHNGKDLLLIKFLTPPVAANKPVLTSAVLAGTIATSLLAFIFFGQSTVSKNSYKLILNRKNWSEEIAQIKKLVPEEVQLNATMNLAGHFILRNEVFPQLNPLLDYVLMDLNTNFADKKEMDMLRGKMLSDGYKVIFTKADHGKHLVLFAKTSPHKSCPDNIFTLNSEEEWDMCGNSIETEQKDFKVKLDIQNKVLKLFIRPVTLLKYDANIVIWLTQNGNVLTVNNTFGNGVTPAFCARPDQVFIMTENLPEGWDSNVVFQIRIIPRPAIN